MARRLWAMARRLWAMTRRLWAMARRHWGRVGALPAVALAYGACGVPGESTGEERGRPACFDGVDNDGDGLTDCDDPYCEIVCEEICTDTVDNDGDGRNGCEDPKCAGKQCWTPREICGNDRDDDHNGLHECDDPACADVDLCRPRPVEICDNTLDDDQNGAADCKDPACELAPNCEQCDNGIDDDQNGLADCDDPFCRGFCGLIERCTGGEDEDRDGAVDCADSSCQRHDACISGCRVYVKMDTPDWATKYGDSCSEGSICTCAGAPGCPTENPNPVDVIGDLLGVTELCNAPQTCDDGGGCRGLDGTYTVRLVRARVGVDDVLNEPELYVEVNGQRISEVENTYELECDDCYLVLDVPETTTLNVTLWDQDILSLPNESDIDHSDLVASCDFELDERTLRERGLSCISSTAYVELTIEPHPG